MTPSQLHLGYKTSPAVGVQRFPSEPVEVVPWHQAYPSQRHTVSTYVTVRQRQQELLDVCTNKIRDAFEVTRTAEVPIVNSVTSEKIPIPSFVNAIGATKTQNALISNVEASHSSRILKKDKIDTKDSELQQEEDNRDETLQLKSESDELERTRNRANVAADSIANDTPSHNTEGNGKNFSDGTADHAFYTPRKIQHVPKRSMEVTSGNQPSNSIGVVADTPRIDVQQAAFLPKFYPEATSAFVELLDLWKNKRHSAEPLSEVEMRALSRVFFDTMPAERVKLINAQRVEQPATLNVFCEEEQRSLDMERAKQKKHKEFMMLHGTGWKTVRPIYAGGLDPDCGHASKGSWLGQNAEACHTYAAKDPGPEEEDGRRLFAMFAVACLPNHNDGDAERSFGVWRMMSRNRMCPAYLLIYAAPMDVRTKRTFPLPRMNRCAQLMQRQSHEDLWSAEARTSGSPKTMSHSKTPSLLLQPSCETSCPSSASQRSCEDFTTESQSSDSSSRIVYSSKRNRDEVCTAKMRSARSPNRFKSPSPQRNRASKNCRTPPQQNSMDSPHAGCDDHCAQEALSSSNVMQGGSSRSPPRCSPLRDDNRDRHARSPGASSSFARSKNVTANSPSHWELESDEGWISFYPGVGYNDQPGVQQDLSYRRFWYRLSFDVNGTTGTQTNLSTGKMRRLRRVADEKDSQEVVHEVPFTSFESYPSEESSATFLRPKWS